MMAHEVQELDLPKRFRKWSGLIALLLFALCAALLLHKALLPQFTLVPLEIIQDIKPWDHLALGPRHNRLIIDPFFIFYPNRALQTAAVQSGRLPLWNPYLFTGTPVVADPNFQPFYLPNLLLAAFLPAARALPWLAWFHLTLTGLFMYLFLRRQRLAWIAAVLGGGIWLLNGYLMVWLENPHRLSTAAWMPAVFWAFEVAVEDRKPAWAALGGLFLGLAVLGGQVQFVFIFGLVLFLYALIKSFFQARGEGRPFRPLAYLLLVALIGFSIGSVVILPAAEFSSFSQRTLSDAATILDSRWPARQLITLIAPDFYGNPATEAPYWGAINYAEVTVYFGVVALLLAISAVFVARNKRFLLTSLILTAVVLSIALGTPAARALALVPGFQYLALRRTIVFIPFLGSWLAAAGMDGWLQSDISWRRTFSALGLSLLLMAVTILATTIFLGQDFSDNRTTAVIALWHATVLLGIAIILLLAMRRQPFIIGLLLLLLALGEVLQWGSDFNPITSIDYLYPENAVTQYLNQEPEPFRVLPLQAGKTVFGPNILSIFGIEDITGYSSLIKRDYAALLKAMDDDIEIGWMRGNENILVMSHFHPLVGMLNVKYILTAEELLNQPELKLVGQMDGVWVYENLTAGDRAFLVHEVSEVSPESVLPTLLSADFDWRRRALITRDAITRDAITEALPAEQKAQLTDSPPQMSGDVENTRDVDITRYEAEEVTISVDTPEPAFLVLADAYDPGWIARLDGQSVPIYKTNGVLRGVYVPEGIHEIAFQFRPRTLQIGAVLCLTGLLLALGVWFFAWRRQSRSKA
ncbi:MAG: YfhO family protein [Candidatus Promineifilaceae bacterium]